MSWSRVCAAVTAAALCLALAACGFHPLYGRGNDAASAAELESVYVPPLKDREGQLVHTYLTRGLNPDGRSGPTQYRLEIGLTSSTSDLGIRQDQTATRRNLTLSAQVQLHDIDTNKVVYRTTSSVVISYNIVEAHFATVSAQEDATDRAARAIADDIRTRVSVFLANRKSRT